MGFIGKTNSSTAAKSTPFSMADSLPVQTKLTVSKSSDPAEKEADTVARKVVDEQKEKAAAPKKDDLKKTEQPQAAAETTPDTKKEGIKTKGDDQKKDVQKKGEQKEEKKAAKKEEAGEKKDKVSKKEDKQQEAKKKGEEKEEMKATKKEDPKKEVQKKGDEKEEMKASRKDDKKKDVQKKGDQEEKKVAKKEENGKDKKPVDQEKETNAKPKSISKKDGPSKDDKPNIQQKPQAKSIRKESSTGAKGEQQAEPDSDEAKMQAVEQKINAKKGSGKALDAQTKTSMEQSFNYDFSEVKIHTDKESAELCGTLNAQAFAIGNDIFFNTGKYDPESDQGKELLAHELTHVVQQKDQVQRSVAYRNPAPSAGAGATNAGRLEGDQIILPSLEVPTFKSRNTGKFGTSATRKRNYSRKAASGGKGQVDIWKADPGVESGTKAAVDKLKAKAGKKPSAPDVYYLKWKGIKLFGKEEQLVQNSKIPLWNTSGEVSAFDVDHILELQLVGGENSIDNMELLNFSGNRSSGSQISNNIEKAVQNFITQTNQSITLEQAMGKDYEIKFEKVSFTGKTDKSSKGSGSEGFWSYDQVSKGEHLKNFEKMSDREIEQVAGKEDNPVVFTSEAGGAMMRADSLKRMPGFEGNINLAKSGAIAGNVTGKFNPNPKIFEPIDNISINIYTMDGVDFGGYMKRRTRGGGNLETILSNLKVKGMSPIEIDMAEMLPDVGIVAKGRIKPSVEIIKDLYIDFSIEGKNVILSRTFSAGQIQGIPPPLKVTDASLTVFANGGTGAIGITGKINFEINKVGKGEISASGDSNGVFKLNGNFEFDEKLFGGVKANVKASYEHTEGGEDKWDINGNIKIPKGKLKGIESAEINVNYADRIFKADGSAKFDVPGLEDGKMSVTYGNDQLVIQGEANFKHKFIKSGKVTAKVEAVGDAMKVSMSGNAKPNIPGIDSDLSVSYEDGVFTVSGTVAYAKGRLAGSATVGVTNQVVGADGKPTGAASKDLSVFGSGSLTLKITDWLQGTAGVTFKPDGNIEVIGKIGIPAAVDIFPKKEIKKDIFKAPTIEIPLFAIPVGSRSIGLVATIGGGAEAYASIGPGQLTDAAVEVKYNPADEENMSVTGSAKFKVPAEAGLRLFVRAGIGLSIGIARVAGGIEIGGALGIEGAAEAGVTVNWSPATGFKLDAEAALSVQPKFKFDVNAYVEAVLDLWITEFRKEWKWNLYAFEWGPAMKFGVKFPVHYEENKPFDISLDDVQFEAPDISVGDFAKGIGQQLF